MSTRPGDAMPIAHPYPAPPPPGQPQVHTHTYAAPPPPPPMHAPYGPPPQVHSSSTPHPQQHPHWQAAPARTQTQLIPTPVLGRPSIAGAPGPHQQQQLQFARPPSMASHHGVYMVPRVPYPPPPHIVAAQQMVAAHQARSVEYVVQQAQRHESGGPLYRNAGPASPYESAQAHTAASTGPSQPHEVAAPRPTYLAPPPTEATRPSSASAPPPPTYTPSAAPPAPPPPQVQDHRSAAPPAHSAECAVSTPDVPRDSPPTTVTDHQPNSAAPSASPAPHGSAQVRLPVIHPSFFNSVRDALDPLLKGYAHAIASPVVQLSKNMSGATQVINEQITELVDEVGEVRREGEARGKAVQDVADRVARVEAALGGMEEDKKAVMEMLTRIDSNMADVRARLQERDATPPENKRPEKEYVDASVSAIPPDPGPVLQSSRVQDSETDVGTPVPPERKLQSNGVFPLPLPPFEDFSRLMNSRPRLAQSSPFSYSPRRFEETCSASSSSSEVEELGPAHWTERPSQESTLRHASTRSSRYLLESMESPLRNLSTVPRAGPSSISPERARQRQIHSAFSLQSVEHLPTPRPSYTDRSRESSLVRDYLLAPTEASATREASVVGTSGDALAQAGSSSASASMSEGQKELSPLSDLTSVEELRGSPLLDAKARTAQALWDSMTPMTPARELSPLTEISSPEEGVRVKVEPAAKRGRKRKLDAVDGGAGVRRRLSAPGLSKRKRGVSAGGRKRRKTELGQVKVEKEGKGRKVKGVAWPKVIEGGARQFVQCDGCHTWYHYACVAIEADDPRLEEDVTFHCPKCLTFPENVTRRKSKHLEREDHNVPAVCARPGCTIQAHQDEYFVERIIGRQLVPSVGAKIGDTYLWLVKWLGYHVSQASWTLEDDMGDVPELISEFEDAARAEGHDLDPSTEVLLQEAIDGGWKNAA